MPIRCQPVAPNRSRARWLQAAPGLLFVMALAACAGPLRSSTLDTPEQRLRLVQAKSLVAQGHAMEEARRLGAAKELFAKAFALYRQLGRSPFLAEQGYSRVSQRAPPSVHTLSGHTAAVRAVAFSPDSRFAATGSKDQTARIWDVATGRLLRTLQPHAGPVTDVAFSEDGRTLLSASADGVLRLWDPLTGKLLQSLSGHEGGVWRARFLPGARALLSYGNDKTLRRWDLSTGTQEVLLRHTQHFFSLAVSRDGTRALLGTVDAALLVELSTGEVLATLGGFGTPGDKSTLHPMMFAYQVISAAFTPDGKLAALGCTDNVLELWDLEETRLLSAERHHVAGINALTFTRGGRELLLGYGDANVGHARLDLLLSQEEAHQPLFWGHEDAVVSLAESPDGRWILSGSTDHTARLWSTAPRARDIRQGGELGLGQSLDLSPDGRLAVATDFTENEATLWDVETHQQLSTLRNAHELSTAVFTPDGRYVATGDAAGAVNLWALPSGRRVRTLAGHAPSAVTTLAPGGTGSLLVSGGTDGTVKVWDGASGRLLRTLPARGAGVTHVASSADGTRIVAAYGGTALIVWDGQEARELPSSARFESLAISRDGKRVLAGSQDTHAYLWDLSTGAPPLTLKGHTDTVLGVAFTPDGTVALSASADGLVKLWLTDSGLEFKTWDGYPGPVHHVRLSADARRVVASGLKGRLMVWETGRTSRYLEAEAALEGARAALIRDERDMVALRTLIGWYLFLGRLDDARALLSQAHSLDEATPHLAFAHALWEAGEWEAALYEFGRARAQREAPEEYLGLCITALAQQAFDLTP